MRSVSLVLRFSVMCISLAAVMWLAGCASTQKTSTVQSTTYTEDLAWVRPPVAMPEEKPKQPDAVQERQTAEAKLAINKPLDTVLDSIDRIHLAKKSVDGFTIQVYSGLDREVALNTRKELTISLPEILSEVQYAQPNFQVKAGRYFTRIEAQRDFLAIKKVFPSAIVIPDKIPIQ